MRGDPASSVTGVSYVPWRLEGSAFTPSYYYARYGQAQHQHPSVEHRDELTDRTLSTLPELSNPSCCPTLRNILASSSELKTESTSSPPARLRARNSSWRF